MQIPTTSLTDRAFDIASGSAAAGRYDREQRSYRRRPYHGWIAFMAMPTAGRRPTPITLRGRDICAGGIGAISGRRLEPGTRGALLVRRSDGRPVVLGATIVYCQRRDEMDYACGLHFVDLATPVAVDDFRLPDGTLPEIGPASSAE